jgi:hypothetical protein
MLEANKTYRDNDGRKITIGGRIGEYGPARPFVWAINGDWYDEKTGSFITWTKKEGDKLHPVDSRRSISNHTPIAN